MLNKEVTIRYSESEAANRLGLSVQQLRVLVKTHISDDEELPEDATFQPSDLIVLSVLAGRPSTATVH